MLSSRVYLMIAVLVSGMVAIPSAPSEAAAPSLVNYQGILTDGSGTPQVGGPFSITFSIYDDASATNPALWSELQSVTTDAQGRFNVLLGTVTPLTDAVFSGPDRWLGTKVSPDLSDLLPRTRIATVAYAFRPATVDGATGGNITSKVSIGSGHTNTGDDAFVTGVDNQVTGNYSAVGGGALNIASGESSIIAGGQQDTASGFASSIGGGASNAATDTYARVGGGVFNRASGVFSLVGGGILNNASNEGAIVGGGGSNAAGGLYSIVGGGTGNSADAEGSTVGGGGRNHARGQYSTVGGGGGASVDDSNSALGGYSAVGGGRANVASGNSATVGGGGGNTASGRAATVGGGGLVIPFFGLGNVASGHYSTVGGGTSNTTGGFGATVGGGEVNMAGGDGATVGGGSSNTASGFSATVPGGNDNTAAGDYSFAAGLQAKANHNGTFVWGDDVFADFASTADNQFLIRASGGVGIGTNSPSEQLHVVGNVLATGCVIGSNIACPSDSRFKKNIVAMTDALDAIDRLRGVNYEWNRDRFPDQGFGQGQQVGLIAQEVRKVVPQAVIEQSDGYLAVDYARLVPLLIEGMKEQQRTIQGQQERIEKLERQFEQIVP